MSKLKLLDKGFMLIQDVRLSYPNLWAPFKDKKDPLKPGKYSGRFWLDKTTHKAEADTIFAKIIEMSMAEAKVKLPNDKFCLRNGTHIGKEELMGQYVLSASEKSRPEVRNKANVIVQEGEKGAPYAGCYVDLVFGLWYQNNDFGKKINANLIGVKFNRDGEAFSTIERPDLDEVFGSREASSFTAGAGGGLDDEDF